MLDKEIGDALKALSHQENVTLFMTLLAAFQLLLHRYTAQEEVVVGAPIAGRTRPELEGLIGFFVNTLVLRNDFSGNPTFKELLVRVRQVCLDAYTHQDVPFEKLVEVLRPERSLSQSPLFQIVFVLENAPAEALRFGDLAITPLEVDKEFAKFDLTVSMHEETDGLRAVFNYSADLFDGATIDRMIRHFKTLLEGIVADPDQRISELPMLSEAEKRQLLIEWNDTRTSYPRDKCIHQLFEEQVERTPNATAVVFEDEQLTYRELNKRANQLAQYLRKLGVGPEVLVGICVERSLEIIIGLLGILKAGGAYVPLDPAYPKERLAFIMQDSQVRAVLTQQTTVSSLPVTNACIVCLDNLTQPNEIEALPVALASVSAAADNLAYVIYTSGSTGKPKGVLITHYNVARLFEATRSWFSFDQNDVWTLFHSYAFDFSVWEIWGALLHGGRLVIVPYEVSRSPKVFYELLYTEKVTVLNQTPSAFRQLIQVEQSLSGPPELSLRLVIFGGEALDFRSLIPWFDRHGDRSPRLVNMYGITETTVHVTYRPITEEDLSGTAGSLVGVPIPDLELYVLGKNQNPVPIGVPGELYVGGGGVGRGYLNRPELTAERFIPNPFRYGTAANLYRSGDLARFLPNGDIEYLGRIDTQVKIGGYRIEPGEIEFVLSQHPAVRETVVVAREDVPGDKRLVAYIIALAEQRPTVDDLNDFLRTKLPNYMVPSIFVFLDSLPLTPNGKVDRRALPVPDQTRPELVEIYVAPRTQVEEMVAAIWAQVLGLEKVGIRDNFFDLGGQSLLATQVISRVREAFQFDVALSSLFKKPTVAGLAECIEESRKSETVQALPIIPMPRDGDLPLSFAQQRLWFLDQLEPNSSAYNFLSAQRLNGSLDIGALDQSLNEIVRRHEALRTTFSTVGGQPVQKISPSLSLPLTLVDLSHLPDSEREAEVGELSNEEAQRPFDLAHGPLVRATLLRLNDEDHVLLLTIHHIVSDGWSMGVLFRELSVLYEAFSNGNPSPLEELPVQYADFAQWQRNWLQGEVLEIQLGYWKTHLDNNPTLQLLTDRPRPAVQSYRGATQSIALSRELIEALKTLSRQQGVTLFMTLLGAFQSLLYRYTGQDDVVVGSPIAGRNRTEIEGLIGFFVNNLVLRTDFSRNPTFKEILSRVREVALGAYAHQDVPFEKLVEALQPERNLSHSPLFQIMFAVENVPTQLLELSGLAVSPVDIKGGTAKFDLQLSIADEQAFKAKVQYNTDLFDALTITRLLGHFQTLLEGIVADPDQRISELPMLSEAEKRQLLIEWNDTRTSYPRDKCIHQLFEEQVERTPNATAVVFEDGQLTYRELNKRANQLAQYLRKLGVGPEVLVGICVERSLEIIIGLLGILKAGGAYVPLDPAYPKERLAFMLDDTQAPVLLTQQRLIETLPEHNARVVCVDRDWKEIEKEAEESPDNKVTAENLAYVIYTSGSTGKPKGVEVPHRGILRLLFGVEYVQLDATQTFLHLAPISFDAATFELWGALLHGAKCVLFPGKIPSPKELGDMLHVHGISTLWLTASLFNTVIDEAPEALSGVRQLLIGGEALSVPHVRRALSLLPETKIINGYGPTESTTFTCCYSIPRQLSDSIHSVSIGRPISNTQVYLLDAHLQLVPIGIPGELYIGGDGLARDYLNLPELTEERFISHPFSSQPGSRLYRTGDLVRYLIDGNIEFLGRIDNQVKIRGYRIELGEIESVLGQHPAVRETIVVAREDAPGDKRLVAYIIALAEQRPTVDDLNDFLRTKLPSYMVPSKFVFLDSLPLTPNGKVDRQALLATDGARTASNESFIAPRNHLERQLADIWERVLGVQTIGIKDNFFDLGGHSLLAVRVTSQIEKIFGKKLSLTSFFQAPTVEQLANVLSNEIQLAPWSSLIPIQPNGSKPPFFWVHGEASDAFLSRYLDPDQPLYGILHQSHDGQPARYTTVQDIAAHYLREIRTVQPQGPYFLGGYCFGAMVAFEMAQQLKNQDEKVAFLVLLSPCSLRHDQFMNHLPRNTSGASTNGRLSRDNFSRLLQNLKLLGPQRKLTYVLKRLKGATLLWVLGPLREIAEKAACKVYWSLGYRLPPSLRIPYLMDVYDKANRAYVPEVYPGRLVIYKDEGSSDPRTWKTLAVGEFDIHEVPGDHLDVLKEPNVKVWGSHLRTYLHRTQAELRGSEGRDQKSELGNWRST